jgi:hypothetical protein
MSAAYNILPSSDTTLTARGQFDVMEKFFCSEEAKVFSHDEIEYRLRSDGRELVRLMMQEYLDLRSKSEKKLRVVHNAEGGAHRKSRLLSRNLTTIFGRVRVQRLGYQADKMASLFPLSASLNLPKELYSFGVRQLVAEQAAKGSFDEVVKELTVQTGATVHKRQVEGLARSAAQDFDAFYAQRRLDTSEVSGEALLVLTMDGKGIAMRNEGLRETTRNAAKQSSHKLEKRLSKGEKKNRKRMAEVAAVYLVEPFYRTASDVLKPLGPVHELCPEPLARPKPTHKRVWASIDGTMGHVICEAFDEAERLDPEHRRDWVVTVDGNAEQIRLIREQAVKRGVQVSLILDVIHVIEYLWKAAYCFHPDGSKEAQAWVSRRLKHLLSGHDASQVAAGIRRSASCQNLSPDKRKSADNCARYLINHRDMLLYDDALARGLPIGTGIIEGACRYLVKDRMDRTGARWSLQGAEAVLRLRALYTNGDLEEYFKFHFEQEYLRNHQSRYANGNVPELFDKAPSRSHKLRSVA